MDPEEFAAARGERLTSADDKVRPLVAAALASGDWSAVAAHAEQLWLEIFSDTAPGAYPDVQLKAFRKQLLESLEKTRMPDGEPDETQIERVTKWAGTFIVNNAEYHGAFAAGNRQKRWITRGDERVRDIHAAVAGQTVPIGGTFKVGGYDLHYPGEPVGPPSVWIECRCILQGTNKRRSTMSRDSLFEEIPALISGRAPGAPATEATVAGLAVLAQDTGRVLMIQRALDPDDPAQGKWEFPGGHLNDGETPDAAAQREWTEEVGMPLPSGTAGGTWMATNGVYAGYVHLVASEELVPTHEGREEAGDPDNPEEDKIEAIAWWSPEDLRDNPAVRTELALDLDLVYAALTAEPQEQAEPEYPAEEEEETMPKPEEFSIREDLADTEVEEVAPDDVEPLIDDELEIPIHGVAAPIGRMSGDGRRFAKDAEVRWRQLPLPIFFQRATADGHDGAERAGRIDKMWVEDELIKYSGFAKNNPAGMEMVEGIVFGDVHSVSVDLGAMEYALLDNEVVNGMPVAELSLVEIAGLTAVGVGAFAEAYIALGDCDCPDEVGDPVDPEAGMDGEEASADLFSSLATMGVVDLTELTEEEVFQFDTLELADGFEAALAWLQQNHPEAMTASGSAMVASGTFAPGTKDGPGWITNPVPTGRIRRYWTHGEGAAKIRWGVPGDFNRCRKQLAKYIKNPDWLAGACANMHKEATGVWPGRETGRNHSTEVPAFGLIASAAPAEVIPAEWFSEPTDGLTTIVVTPEGRTYGYIAEWGVCHIGIDGVCETAPSSPSDYAYFLTGEVDTDQGTQRVGSLTIGIGHASTRVSRAAATAHYERSDSIVADVMVGENGYGIWFAGAIREGIEPAVVREVRATAKLSGDWRWVGPNLELIAATIVGVRGFNVPRTALAASGGHQTALVAAGIVGEMPAPASEEGITAKRLVELGMVDAVADELERRMSRAARVAAIARRSDSTIKPARLALVKERIGR